MIIRSAQFVKSCVRPAQYPPALLPEVAFAGRSNVGKSSLINCLLQRRKLVRTSRTPGRTQTINFFDVNQLFTFVDLPGYGFAKVPREIRDSWGPMVQAYLTGRPTLRAVVQILDARHPPTADDCSLFAWLAERAVVTIPVLTKVDKIKRSKLDAHLRQGASVLGVDPKLLILFSAETAAGRDGLWERILGELHLEEGETDS